MSYISDTKHEKFIFYIRIKYWKQVNYHFKFNDLLFKLFLIDSGIGINEK